MSRSVPPSRHPWLPCLLAATAGCHTYEPAPVDLAAHARAFAARLPSSTLVPPAAAAEPSVATPPNTADGLDRAAGRLVAMCFHPDCRAARAAARVTAAELAHAGRLGDPQLSVDVLRILESVPHPWLVASALDVTVPWSGRLGLERELANATHEAERTAVLLAEAAAADALDAAWLRWSHEHARAAVLTELCTQLRELERIGERLAAAGALTHAGARVFSLELAQREDELAQANDAAARGQLAVKQRLGLHPAAPVRLVPATDLSPRVADVERRAATLEHGPRVLTARQAHRRAEAALALAVRRQWPDLGLGPRFEEEDAQPRLGLGFVLPLPLFAGNDAAIARASAARDAAADALSAALEVATQELADAELWLQQAARQRQFVLDRLVPLADRQLRDGRALADAGQLEPMLLLDALVRTHDARARVLAADLELALAANTLNLRTAVPGLLPVEPAAGAR